MNNYGELFADELTKWSIEAGFSGVSFISMHHMDQKWLSYLILMTVSIDIHLKILENGLWIL